MSDTIEMTTIAGDKDKGEDDEDHITDDYDIQEYHDIQIQNDDHVHNGHHRNASRETDFFTNYDANSSKRKKKKVKKKSNETLMDIITSELASAESAVTQNVINRVNNFNDEAGFLVDEPKAIEYFQSRRSWGGHSSWLNYSTGNLNLNPAYPNILDTDHSKPILTRYVQPQYEHENQVPNKHQTKFLDIKISNLKFKVHHCFSLEKLLTEKLITVYEDYRKLKDNAQTIANELKINREAKLNLKKDLETISSNKDNVIFDPTIRKYMAKIIKLNAVKVENIKKEIEIINILSYLWSDIVSIREKQQWVTTTVKVIMAENNDDNEIENEWIQIYNSEFSYLVDKVEFDFVSKYIDYKEAMKSLGSGDRKRLSKPKLEIDEEILKKYARALADDLMKINKLVVELDFDEKILKRSSRSEHEKVVSNFYFKIYVDDVYVCESEFYTDHSFDVQFQDFLSVEILPSNKIVTISLFENNTQASAMNFNISDIKKSITAASSEKVEFIFLHEVPANDKHIGSGNTIKDISALNKIRLKSSNLFKGKLYTSCETNLNIGWNEDLNQNEKDAIIEYKKTDLQIKRLINGIDEIRLDTLKSLVEKVYDVDISDDENVIETLRNLNDTKLTIKESFEFDDDSDEMTRIKLLRLRSNGDLFEVGNKPIPFHAKQLTTDQLKCLQNNEKYDRNLVDYSDEKFLDLDPIEVQRFKRIKQIERLNNSIQKNLNDKLSQKSVRDVVWDFHNLSFSFRNFFVRSNVPSTSTPNLNSKRHLGSGNDRESDIQITIIKAYNLPERTVSAIVEESAYVDDSIAGFKVKALRPFVRIYYDGNAVQTGTAIGCHPTWNHTLKLKANGNRYAALQINIYDEQKEQVADESQSDQSYQGTLRYRCHNRWLGSLHVPLQSVFTMGKLQGTFKVNTPTYLLGYENRSNARDKDSNQLIPQVTQLLKKETPFLSMQITIPRNSTSNHIPLPNDGDDHAVKHLNKYLEQFHNEFPTRNLNLTSVDSAGKNKCITQFIQPVLLPDYELFPKNSKRVDSAKSSNLSKSSSSKSADGRKSIDVERGIPSPETERDSIYSGYDKSWKSENDLDRLIDMALRYVSLIPSYEISAARVVTLSSLELLRTQYGSPLDHSILLASYFLYLGLKTYIAIGLGLPRGSSSYVLTKYDTKSRKMQLSSETVNESRGFLAKNETSSWFLFDAVKGERFELRDASCPLKTVEYIFNNDNIWVNVQNSQDCEGVSFDLSKSSDWRQVFDKTVFLIKQPIISDSNLYQVPKSTERLREIIEERIKIKIQKWRTHNKTVWNRYCSSVLREILPHLEYWALHPSSQKPSLGQKLRQMILTYKTYGFSLNMPFLNRKAITSTVKSTTIHMSDDPNIEFGLAVEVYTYPNDVFSVWVFLVSLSKI